MHRPSRPASRKASKRSVGYSPVLSISRARGFTLSWARRRTLSLQLGSARRAARSSTGATTRLRAAASRGHRGGNWADAGVALRPTCGAGGRCAGAPARSCLPRRPHARVRPGRAPGTPGGPGIRRRSPWPRPRRPRPPVTGKKISTSRPRQAARLRHVVALMESTSYVTVCVRAPLGGCSPRPRPPREIGGTAIMAQPSDRCKVRVGGESRELSPEVRKPAARGRGAPCAPRGRPTARPGSVGPSSVRAS